MIGLRGGTAGRRFTLLYAAVFLLSGVVLLALTFLLSGTRITSVAPEGNTPGRNAPVGGDQGRIRALQEELSRVDEQRSRQLLIGSLVALLLMAAVSLLVGRVLAGQALRPLRLITAATRRISADNLDQRLAVSGPADEVRDLAETIDGLLERLEAAFAAQGRFAANASHELRTPLATMRASLDVAAAKPDAARQTVALADRLRGQLDRVDDLLDGFLALARARHVAPSGRVDLAGLVTGAVRERAGATAAKRLTVTTEVAAEVAVPGDAALLARLVDNVVQNAVVHNTDGGWIRFGLDRDGGRARFTVATGGPVLDQRDVDRLAQPFERLGADRTGSETGTGLGLSIVAAIAAAHHGRLGLLARPDGGLLVTVTLPAVPA